MKGTARHVATRGGPPRGKYMNRPSIEYSGSGDDLFYEAWGGRWFRASLKAVEEGIQFFREMYYESPDAPSEWDGNYVSYNDLYSLWNISVSDFGGRNGYSPSEDYRVDNLDFTITFFKPGEHELADKMGESVYIIEPNEVPYESYMEV